MTAPRFADAEVGQQIEAERYEVTRESLVRYAGASGDFNIIHWNERAALEVGLPDVIAHGNLTMALGARYVVNWTGDPTSMREYGVRFTRPVVVPDDGVGATVEIVGRIAEVLDNNCVRIDLTVTSGGLKVLGQSRAVVRLP